ncbi:hypothetical protein RirG_052380 [Rhizophagus irregularis DAOM 197198w]|nr:hypothetical protein RirG_052380 [Rhizophagus irregularis DAOM 197198w]
MEVKKIKEKYAWQAFRKLDEKENGKNDFILVKEYIKNMIKYILIYFNNENDLLQAIYKSTMEEDLGIGLQMKGQDELIGKDGVFKKNNKFSVPTHTISNGEKFLDALSSPLSTIPRSKEEHEELDDLNNKFSERLDNLEKKKELSNKEGTTSKERDNFNKNKKCAVTTQGRKEDSDSEC